MYSENSKIVIYLDSFSKQIYNIWVIFYLYQSLRPLPIYSIFLWFRLTRTYILQANRTAFNQYIVNPTCKLRHAAHETRQHFVGVKSMQRSGTEAIRTQIQPSKPIREITNITNRQNTKRTNGPIPKRWPLSNRTELKT